MEAKAPTFLDFTFLLPLGRFLSRWCVRRVNRAIGVQYSTRGSSLCVFVVRGDLIIIVELGGALGFLLLLVHGAISSGRGPRVGLRRCPRVICVAGP